MKNHKRALSLVLALASVLILAVGSVAFFTDRMTASASATAGSLDLELTSMTKSHSTALKPGYGVKFDVTVENKGNKSADVFENLVLTSPIVMDKTAPEFEIYYAKDVTLDSNNKATISGEPVATSTNRVISDDGKKISYTMKADAFVLNGSGTDAETETEANGKTSHTSSFVLVFGSNADNDFINKTVTIDYEAQAKQHRNTSDATWNSISTTIEWAGDSTHQSVPAKN